MALGEPAADCSTTRKSGTCPSRSRQGKCRPGKPSPSPAKVKLSSSAWTRIEAISAGVSRFRSALSRRAVRCRGLAAAAGFDGPRADTRFASAPAIRAADGAPSAPAGTPAREREFGPASIAALASLRVDRPLSHVRLPASGVPRLAATPSLPNRHRACQTECFHGECRRCAGGFDTAIGARSAQCR